MDWDKWGIIYFLFAMFLGLMIELANYNTVSGLGLISFCLIMILFFLIFNAFNNYCAKNTKESILN